MEKSKEYERRFKKVRKTEKAARLFTKYKLTKMGYHSVSLESKKGFESKGVVDVVAVRKFYEGDPDKVEIVLLQRKGNVAVSEKELKRLRAAKKKAVVKYGIAEYRKGKLAEVEIFNR
jgi:cell fate (sporulation/competence/biofilm development) regulator YlbF (YheA/YmcA/DUF963 family)